MKNLITLLIIGIASVVVVQAANPVLYNQTINVDGKGSITVTENGTTHVYTATAEPADGYMFWKWVTNTGTDYATTPSITISNIASETIYKAKFARGYHTTFIDGSHQYNFQTFDGCKIEELPTCVAEQGYIFAGWSDTQGGSVNPTYVDGYEPKADKTLYSVYMVSRLIVTSQKSTTDWPVTPSSAPSCVVEIRNGGVLTISETSQASQLRFDSIIIRPGGKMVVPSNHYAATKVLVMQAGDSVQNTYYYRYPQMVVNGYLSVTSGAIYYDYLLNNIQQYPLSLPLNVQVSAVTYADGSAAQFGKDWYVAYYDGADRAKNLNGWKYLPNTTTTLERGKGYTTFAFPKMHKYGEHGTMMYDNFIRLRFPMAINTSYTESAMPNIAVSAHNAARNSDVGWNLMGNPYFANYSNVGGLTNNGIGLLELNNGTYQWVSNVRYVVLPADNGRAYQSVLASSATIPAFKNFFVQIGAGDALSMPLANRAQNVPTRMLANNEEDEIATGIVLSNATTSDYVGILLGDNFSENYEINADLLKFGHNQGVNVYAYIQSEELAFAAINPQFATMAIPVGYIAPKNGTYTFSIDTDYPQDDLEHVYLYDSQEKKSVDLLQDSYTFTSIQGTNNTRFTLSVITRKIVSELQDNLMPEVKSSATFIRNNRLYILHNGILYNAIGNQIQQ